MTREGLDDDQAPADPLLLSGPRRLQRLGAVNPFNPGSAFGLHGRVGGRRPVGHRRPLGRRELPAAAITGVIAVDPPEVQLDEPVSIRLSGFPAEPRGHDPGEHGGRGLPRTSSDTGLVRESEATFMTDATGAVDVPSASARARQLRHRRTRWACSGRCDEATRRAPRRRTPAHRSRFAQYRYAAHGRGGRQPTSRRPRSPRTWAHRT